MWTILHRWQPPNSRKRHYSQITPPENAIKASEKAIELLKRHSEKEMCLPIQSKG